MTIRYRTPELKEFYEGYEYQRQNAAQEWVDVIFGEDDTTLDDIEYLIGKAEVRVIDHIQMIKDHFEKERAFKRTKWEYKVVQQLNQDYKIRQVYNQLGNDGWEFCAITGINTIFKRKL